MELAHEPRTNAPQLKSGGGEMSAESAERLRKISQELRNCTADVNTLYKTKASVIVSYLSSVMGCFDTCLFSGRCLAYSGQPVKTNVPPPPGPAG